MTLPNEVRALALRLGADPSRVTGHSVLRQTGEMKLSLASQRWHRFSARQTMAVTSCAFDWHAQFSPFGYLSLTDALKAGRGQLDVTALGLIPLVRSAPSVALMSGLFLFAAIVIGIVGRLGEPRLVEAFLAGARDLLGVALIIGLARGIVVVMDAGQITDTILHSAEVTVADLPGAAFISMIYVVELGLSFFVPSTSGLAVLSMPILAPVADFAEVPRSLVVTAFATASGWVNLITPTSAVVMGGLAIGRVPYQRWLRFVWPLLLVLTVIVMGALTLATLI